MAESSVQYIEMAEGVLKLAYTQIPDTDRFRFTLTLESGELTQEKANAILAEVLCTSGFECDVKWHME